MADIDAENTIITDEARKISRNVMLSILGEKEAPNDVPSQGIDQLREFYKGQSKPRDDDSLIIQRQPPFFGGPG